MRLRQFVRAASVAGVCVLFAGAVVNGQSAGLVRVTPLGSHTGELCRNDRAMLFEDPSGIRILYDPGRTVIQILHGDDDYYYSLAAKHEAVIDVFVAPSKHIYQKLGDLLPNRINSIFYVPHGIPITDRLRSSQMGPLRLIFAGRLQDGTEPETCQGLR